MRDFFDSFMELLGLLTNCLKVLKTRTIGAMHMSQIVSDGICDGESDNTIDFDVGIHA